MENKIKMSLAKIVTTLLLSIFVVCGPVAGANLQATIPSHLLECYMNQTLLVRENLLPMSIDAAIALLRKIESYPGLNMDIRTLATTLIYTYRMDGIERNPDVRPSIYVTPFSLSGSQFYRYKLLMDGLIPGTGMQFPTDMLTPEEKCSLHLMLSNSIDRWQRGDEGQLCNNLRNYKEWSRVPRSAQIPPPGHSETDAESFDPRGFYGRTGGSDVRSSSFQSGVPLTTTTGDLSMCPIENGVVYSRYGAVKLGIVLAGIAAGIQSQSISRRNLVALAARANQARGPQFRQQYRPNLYSMYDNSNPNISNTWAATIAGEVAEVALLQGPVYGASMRIGVGGGWNVTLVPKYYFLSENSQDALTDTTIRASIDGLWLGKSIVMWNRLVSGQLKLSQVLKMYYSERGVFDQNVRACQRKTKFSEIAPSDVMYNEALTFSQVLLLEAPIAVTLAEQALEEFNQVAVNKLGQYVSSMKDEDCMTSTITTTQTSRITTRPAVNLYVIIDFSYDFLDAQRIITYLTEQLEVSRYSSNITVFSAKDVAVIVNSTATPLIFYKYFNRTAYNQHTRGFDLPKIVRDIGTFVQGRMTSETQLNVPAGPSHVALVIPYISSAVSDSDRDYINNKLYSYSQTIPDLRFMFASSGAKDRFSSFVQDPSKDIFTLSATLTDDLELRNSLDIVVNRLKEVTRRLINPSCGPNFSGSTSSNLQFTNYVDPTGTHFYRLHPNYFYKTSSGKIRIQGTSSSTLSICQSRSNSLPSPNGTRNDVSCSQITSDSYDIYINDQTCSDAKYAFQCAPIYFSITATQLVTVSNNYICTDDKCEFPDQVKYIITQDGLTCYSGISKIITNHVLLVFLVIVSIAYM